MSETTSKLSLFKYNTTADAKQPFSIKDCMKDNWDKLDAFATSVDTIFSSSFSSNLDKKVFSDINKELGKKLEADVLLAENGYIKFNNGIIICFGVKYGGNMDGYTTITFPCSYKKICRVFLTPGLGNNTDWTTNNNGVVFKFYHNGSFTGTLTLTNFTVGNFYSKNWISIGQ